MGEPNKAKVPTASFLHRCTLFKWQQFQETEQTLRHQQKSQIKHMIYHLVIATIVRNSNNPEKAIPIHIVVKGQRFCLNNKQAEFCA